VEGFREHRTGSNTGPRKACFKRMAEEKKKNRKEGGYKRKHDKIRRINLNGYLWII
jgi:hypothetical protein